MPLPFEQQPNESAKAFAAFSLYLSQGEKRSTQAVAKALAKSAHLVRRWSARWRWAERVQAYAAHLATVERETTEALVRGKAAEWLKRQEEQREEEWRLRNDLLDMAREIRDRWKKRADRCGSLEGYARLCELASKIGRLSSGMPTDKTEVTGEDGGPLLAEFTLALDKVYGAVVDVAPASEPVALPPPGAGADGLPGQRATSSPVSDGGEHQAEAGTPSKQ